MKLFHRITISLTDEEMNLIEELRRDSGDSLSKIFRESLQIYYNLIKASKAAGVDFRKYFSNVNRSPFTFTVLSRSSLPSSTRKFTGFC